MGGLEHHEALKTLLLESEDDLTSTILKYAKTYDYTKYTSTLLQAWRLSISGLTESLIMGLNNFEGIPDFGPDEGFSSDPLAQFGVIEARRHRERGVTLSMFLGLMKYYRQTYMDIIWEKRDGLPDFDYAKRFLERAFDRIEIAFCAEWSASDMEKLVEKLRKTARRMTNEKNLYLTLFESISDPVIILDNEDLVVDLNLAAYRLVNPASIPGERRYRLLSQGEVSESRPADMNSCTGRPVLNLFPLLQSFFTEGNLRPSKLPTDPIECVAGGSKRLFEVSISSMLDVSDKYQGRILLLRDVTEREQMRDEFDRLFELSLDMLCVASMDGHFKRINPAWQETLGWSSDDLLNDSLFHWIHPEDREQSIAAGKKLLNGESLTLFENRVLCKDGSYKWLSWCAKPLVDEGAVFAVARDVTRLVVENQEKRKMAEQLQLLKRLEGLAFLAGGVAHEFNNLLAVVASRSRLLSKKISDTQSESRVHLQEINKAVNRGTELTQTMRACASQETGPRRKTNVAALMKETLGILKHSLKDNILLKTALDFELPTVLIDPSQVRMAVSNLIYNSLDAMSEEGGILTVSCGTFNPTKRKYVPQWPGIVVGEASGEACVSVEIYDTGKGIPVENMEMIFDPFFSANERGRGLGLSAVRGTVLAHSGAIVLESKVNEGTMFRLLFPIHENDRP